MKKITYQAPVSDGWDIAPPKLHFFAVGAVPEAHAKYAHPKLRPFEHRVWEVLDDGTLKIREDLPSEELTPALQREIERRERDGK